MNGLELVCVAVVLLWLGFRLAGEPGSIRRLLLQMLIIATAAWITEDTCIRLYGFYFYAEDRWTLFVDRVPLLILLIWPVVVTSATDLLSALKLPRRHWPWAMGAVVVADAWFIEPAAVDAGLWTWTEPGPFNIPTIGVLGWGLFAVGEGIVRWRRWPPVALLLVGPVVCHLLLLGLWWGCFRHVPGPLPDPVMAGLGWLMSAAVVVTVAKIRPPGLRRLVMLRAPAAVFFFSLLAIYGRDADDVGLVAWCLAFAPPWLSVLLLSSWPPKMDGSAATAATAPQAA